MKNKLRRSIPWIAFCVLGMSHTAGAQSNYKIVDSKDIDMKLSGTSTLHKWSMEAKTFEGEAEFGFASGNDRELNTLSALTFSLEVKDLKSDEKALDKNAYKALRTEQYRDIFYTLTSARVSPEKEGKHLIKTQGHLTIAGVTKEVVMDVYCMVNKDATVECSGSDRLNMTDYKVKPPTFMLGAMKTGDAITLDFTLVYKKK